VFVVGAVFVVSVGFAAALATLPAVLTAAERRTTKKKKKKTKMK